MLSQIPVNLEKIKKEDLDKEILGTGIIAGLDGINFNEKLAATTTNKTSKILIDMAKEEKTHMGYPTLVAAVRVLNYYIYTLN